MIRSFIYLNEIVEDKDDILWFPSGLKREFSPHFARLLASLCDEGKGGGGAGGAKGGGVSYINSRSGDIRVLWWPWHVRPGLASIWTQFCKHSILFLSPHNPRSKVSYDSAPTIYAAPSDVDMATFFVFVLLQVDKLQGAGPLGGVGMIFSVA